MIGKLLAKLVGDPNEKQLKELRPIVAEINSHEAEMHGLTDDDLAAKTYEFKSRLNRGETLDDLLPEAFAAVREASMRVLGMRHFDVQMIGGVVLHQGRIAEMRTGEGKTLVATLAAYLNALEDKAVHVVTVNDYLAKRDAEWMGPVYQFMGLSVGCLQQNSQSFVFDENYQEDGEVPKGEDASAKFASVAGNHLRPASKTDAYACDILYATNNELGFDYLRDHMVSRPEDIVQSTLVYGIVDEVDNILIDEARTPLLISGPGIETNRNYARFASVASKLKPEVDFEVDLKRRNVSLTEVGSEKAERMLGVDTLYSESGDNNELPHLVENAVRAEHIYLRDREYVVRDGEIVLVDEFTGRLMDGRRFSDGMHQALEAKERVRVQAESATYATITLQNYFRMYAKLSGMTGTAATEAEEFSKIYGLDVVEIPTNQEDRRVDRQDLIYVTEGAKWQAAAEKIAELSNAGRPVLVGTTTIEKSQIISQLLTRRGISHRVLNAKEHEGESLVIAQAGIPGAVTVATNMAGRGTDIILGGNPENVIESLNAGRSNGALQNGKSSKRSRKSRRNQRNQNGAQEIATIEDSAPQDPMVVWQEMHDGVIDKGGLFVLGTERHESRRIDNQLRGRCARQGDPGETQFFLSVEDDLVRRFGGDRIKSTLEMLKWDPDVPVENSVLVKSVENAQQKVEGINFEIRKNLVDYDDVANTQRDVVYKMRDRIVDSGDFRDEIRGYIKAAMTRETETYLEGDATVWDIAGLQREVHRYFPIVEILRDEAEFVGRTQSDIEQELHEYVDAVYEQRETLFGDENLKMIEHSVLLCVLDRHWVGHLTRMENMRQSIGLQAIGQRDPLVQYRTMSYQMFNEMNEEIRNEVARAIFHLAPNTPPASPQPSLSGGKPLNQDMLAAAQRIALAQANQQSVMSGANAPRQAGSATVSSVDAPTFGKDGRRLSRRERRALARQNKKKRARASR